MSRNLTQRITHLLNHWPADPVRPYSVSVQNYLQTRLNQISPNDPHASSATQPPPRQTRDAQIPQSQRNAEISEASLNALSSLLENRYARRYPLSPRLRNPASDPEHYDKVVREFEEAPGRDWMGRFWEKVRGFMRFS